VVASRECCQASPMRGGRKGGSLEALYRGDFAGVCGTGRVEEIMQCVREFTMNV